MHELSLATEIICTLKEILPEVKEGCSPLSVVVGVGEFAQVVEDALSFGLEILSQDEGLSHIKWVLEKIEGKCVCLDCGKDVEPNTVPWREEVRFPPTTCPHCGGVVKVEEGWGLAILRIEHEEKDEDDEKCE